MPGVFDRFRHVLVGVDAKTYFRAAIDCGCSYLRLKGVTTCRQHADDVLFQMDFLRAMDELAAKLDRIDEAHPGLQGEITP